MDNAQIRTLWGPTIGDDAAWKVADPGATVRPPDTLAGRTVGSEATASTVQSLATPAPAGRFEFLAEVGRGGMGVVHRVHQSSLSRDVAIKSIPGGGDPDVRQRFIAEAKVTGYLDHPNIVPVHDLCEDDHGEILLAMKLVGGRPWSRLLHPRSEEDQAAAKSFDLDRHLNVLESVCNAIAFAHSREIIHRDLKPENVMVGEFGEVLVMDWGIALDVGDDPRQATHAPHRSTVRSPAGTPSYMSPEQALNHKTIGLCTDVFLLGAILYEIITKRPPYSGKDIFQVLLTAANPPVPQFPKGVPAALRALCVRAMAKRPEDRFASVGDFQRALTEFRRTQQSERATDAAQAALEHSTAEAKRGGNDEVARNRLYGGFADAVAGFGQALTMWEGNQRARAGQRNARLAWATSALANQDLGLAATQAASLADDPEGLRLAARIQSAREARDRSSRQTRLLRRGLVAAGLALLIVFGAGYVLVSREQGRTAHALQQVTDEQRLTSAERDAKESARVEADQQRTLAEDNAKVAAKNAEHADTEAAKARTEAERAKAEEAKAVAASRTALHEAWRGRVELAKVMFEHGMREADRNLSEYASAYFLRAIELAPRNLIPDGYTAQAGQPAWADFAWRAFSLLPLDGHGGSGVSIDHIVADAAFIDNERIVLATGLNGYIKILPEFRDQIRYKGRATAVATAASGKRFAIAPLGEAIAIAGADGKIMAHAGVANQQIASMALSADGTRLAAVVWAEPFTENPEGAITIAEAGPQRLSIFTIDQPQASVVEIAVPGGRVDDVAWSGQNLLLLVPGHILVVDAKGKILVNRAVEGAALALATDGSAVLRCVGAAGGTLAILEQPATGATLGQVLMRGIPTPTTTALGTHRRGVVLGDGMMHTVDFTAGAVTYSSVMAIADLTRRARISPDDRFMVATCWARAASNGVHYMTLDPPRSRQPQAVIGVRRNPFTLVWGSPQDPPPPGAEPPLAVVPAAIGGGLLVHVRNAEKRWECIYFDADYKFRGSFALNDQLRPMPWWGIGPAGILWLELQGDDTDQPLDDDVFRDDRVVAIRADETVPASLAANSVENRRPTHRPYPVCRRLLSYNTTRYVVHQIPYIRGDGSPFRDDASSGSGLVMGGGTMLMQRGYQILYATSQGVIAVGDMALEQRGRLLVSPDGVHAVTMNPLRDVTLWNVQPGVVGLATNPMLNPLQRQGQPSEPTIQRVLSEVAKYDWKAFSMSDNEQYEHATMQSLALVGDGSRLLVAFGNGDLQCWDTLRGSVLWQTIANRCTSLAVDPAGELAAGWDETLPGTILIDIGSGRRLSSIRWPGAVAPGSPVTVAFSKDGLRLMVARQRTCLEWAIRNVHAAEPSPDMASTGVLSPRFAKLYDEVGYRVIPAGPEAGQAVPNFYYTQTQHLWQEQK